MEQTQGDHVNLASLSTFPYLPSPFSTCNLSNPRPTYQYLREKGVIGGDVKWNFAGKFIVDKQGNIFPVKSEKTIESEILKLAQS